MERMVRMPPKQHKDMKLDAKVVASFTDADLAHAVKIVGISGDLDLVAACEKVAQNPLGEKASAERSQPYYLDVTTRKSTRGRASQPCPSFRTSPRADCHDRGHAE